MVAWDGSCAAAAGHGLLFVMVGGMGCVLVLWASGRREKERVSGKKISKIFFSCLCICRGEEAAQCRSKRHRASCFFIYFFFIEKEKIWEWLKNGLWQYLFFFVLKFIFSCIFFINLIIKQNCKTRRIRVANLIIAWKGSFSPCFLFFFLYNTYSFWNFNFYPKFYFIYFSIPRLRDERESC